MIKTLRPYGAIKESLIKCFWEWNSKYYLEDIRGNEFEISKNVFEELMKHDRS